VMLKLLLKREVMEVKLYLKKIIACHYSISRVFTLYYDK